MRFWVFAWLLLPLPAVALPSDRQLQEFAGELCKISSPSPERFEAAVGERLNVWVADNSLTQAELQDPKSAEALGTQLAEFMLRQCPQQASKLFGL